MIFKVYQEKEQAWQREFLKLRSQYESSLLVYQKKATAAEERLLLLQRVSVHSQAARGARFTPYTAITHSLAISSSSSLSLSLSRRLA